MREIEIPWSSVRMFRKLKHSAVFSKNLTTHLTDLDYYRRLQRLDTVAVTTSDKTYRVYVGFQTPTGVIRLISFQQLMSECANPKQRETQAKTYRNFFKSPKEVASLITEEGRVRLYGSETPKPDLVDIWSVGL